PTVRPVAPANKLALRPHPHPTPPQPLGDDHGALEPLVHRYCVRPALYSFSLLGGGHRTDRDDARVPGQPSRDSLCPHALTMCDDHSTSTVAHSPASAPAGTASGWDSLLSCSTRSSRRPSVDRDSSSWIVLRRVMGSGTGG